MRLSTILLAVTTLGLGSRAVSADQITIASGGAGGALEFLDQMIARFEERTGHRVTVTAMPTSTSDQFGLYRTWLAQGSDDVDVLMTDVIWAPQLAANLLDLTEPAADVIGSHFPSVVQSQTVDGKLVAIPVYTAASALFYRTDLLAKHGATVPTTWEELTATAQRIQDAERAEGNTSMWGYVWQGASYEGLTCNALEWVKSFGGGEVVEADGSISINNPEAAAALDLAASWVGTISPEGVLSYQEEESRGVWQTGNAVFMRNWPYAFTLGNEAGSAIAGRFDVAPLPAGPDGSSAATLGGWNVAVSRHSDVPEAATELAFFLASEEAQKERALALSEMPTIAALYEDPEIVAAQPIIPRWLDVLNNSVARPSAPTQSNYNEVSSLFANAVYETLQGNGSADENLADLEHALEELRGDGW